LLLLSEAHDDDLIKLLLRRRQRDVNRGTPLDRDFLRSIAHEGKHESSVGRDLYLVDPV